MLLALAALAQFTQPLTAESVTAALGTLTADDQRTGGPGG